MRSNFPVTTTEYELPEGVTLVSRTDLKGRITYATPCVCRGEQFHRGRTDRKCAQPRASSRYAGRKPLQINQTITQMDQVTQQNAALVEEAAAAASSLQEQASGLSQVVSVFRLNQQPSAAPQHRAPACTSAPMQPPPVKAAIAASRRPGAPAAS